MLDAASGAALRRCPLFRGLDLGAIAPAFRRRSIAPGAVAHGPADLIVVLGGVAIRRSATVPALVEVLICGDVSGEDALFDDGLRRTPARFGETRAAVGLAVLTVPAAVIAARAAVDPRLAYNIAAWFYARINASPTRRRRRDSGR